MSATVNTAQLAAAVRFANRAIVRRSTIPILSYLVLKQDKHGLAVEATDMDRIVHVRIPSKGAKKSFSLCLPALALSEILRGRGGDVSISSNPLETDKDALIMFDGIDSNIALTGLPVADWPTMADKPLTHAFELPSAELADALSRVKPCISDEDTRYYLNGVYMTQHKKTKKAKGTLRVVATDGHKLGVVDLPLPNGADGMPAVIIPKATIADMIASCDAKGSPETVKLSIGREGVRFEHGCITIASKIIDGTFPDYGRCIPTGNDKIVVIDHDLFEKAIKDVSRVLKKTDTRAIKLSFTTDKCTLTASHPDNGTATHAVEVDYKSAPLDIGFNYTYVTAILEALTSGFVTFNLADPGSPTLITGCDDDERDSVLFILMPCRV
jgi:DNA polymerase-3 subunit beta